MGSKGMLVHSVREKVVGHEVKICFRGGGVSQWIVVVKNICNLCFSFCILS